MEKLKSETPQGAAGHSIGRASPETSGCPGWRPSVRPFCGHPRHSGIIVAFSAARTPRAAFGAGDASACCLKHGKKLTLTSVISGLAREQEAGFHNFLPQRQRSSFFLFSSEVTTLACHGTQIKPEFGMQMNCTPVIVTKPSRGPA